MILTTGSLVGSAFYNVLQVVIRLKVLVTGTWYRPSTCISIRYKYLYLARPGNLCKTYGFFVTASRTFQVPVQVLYDDEETTLLR